MLKKRKHKTVSLDSHRKLETLSVMFNKSQSELLDDMIFYFFEIKTDPKEYKGFRDLFARWTKTQEQKILYPIKNRVEQNAENLNSLYDVLEKIERNVDFISDQIPQK